MGGKSTYLRSAAQCLVLAQAGSFIPAAPGSRLGLADALFARVGASDDLAAHRSTFMCEMQETADILRGATADSVVVIDEVGRGTSVGDGLSIGLAVLEDLSSRIGARTLFASHFPELAVAALPPGQPTDPPSSAQPLQRVRCNVMGWQQQQQQQQLGAHQAVQSSIQVTHRVSLHPLHELLQQLQEEEEGEEEGGGKQSSAAEQAGRARARARASSARRAALLSTLGTSFSHGLQVAQHAALPEPVLARAAALLQSINASGMPEAWATAVQEAAAK
jgi:hypothetical protein